MNHNLITAATALVLSGTGAFAQSTLEFSFAQGEAKRWGTSKQEAYDVAIHVGGPTLTGTTVREVRVAVPVADGLSDFSIWLSSELKLDDKTNAPDILSTPVEAEDGILTLCLDEPVAIPAGGLYVGYSFNVVTLDDETKKPMLVTESDNPDAFYIHTSRTYRNWGNQNKAYAAPITLGIDGNFSNDAVAVHTIAEKGILHGTETSSTVTIRNHGLNPVESIGYTMVLNGVKREETVVFPVPLPVAYEDDVRFTVTLPPIEEAGSYPWTLEITEVNGRPNTDRDSSLASMYYVYPYLPEHLALMEEYTGTWCGWCPKGMTALDGMSELYPERFIGLSYHKDNDVMATDIPVPVDVPGAPSATLDRGEALDPYFGTFPQTVTTFRDGIASDWEGICAEPTTADLNLTAVWTDEDKSAIRAETDVKFMRPYSDADMRILYVLASDGLKGPAGDPRWYQKNYYSGMSEYEGTDLEWWVNAPRTVPEVEYNCVAVYSPDIFGTEGSLPAEIGYLEELHHVQTLPLDAACNREGVSLVQDYDRLYVVAAVVDARTGRILNARKARMNGGSGVDVFPADGTKPVSEIFHDLQGRPLNAAPDNGVFLKTVLYNDGRTRTFKQITNNAR